MLHIILNIIIGIISFFAILYLVLNLLFLITSKEYRKWFWEESVRKASKRRGRLGGRTFSDEQYERYRNTGNRNHLIDEDYEG